jgi:hypothetical protein
MRKPPKDTLICCQSKNDGTISTTRERSHPPDEFTIFQSNRLTIFTAFPEKNAKCDRKHYRIVRKSREQWLLNSSSIGHSDPDNFTVDFMKARDGFSEDMLSGGRKFMSLPQATDAVGATTRMIGQSPASNSLN